MKTLIRTGLVWSTACMAAMFGILLFAAFSLPAGVQIPVHWNAAGTADRYADRMTALTILAAPVGIMLLTNLLLAGLPSISPKPENILKSAKTYLVAWIGANILILGITALIAFAMVRSIEESNSPWMVQIILSAVCIFIIAIGNYLPKTKSNWFVGVRTPWTLTSDYTWTKTHRLAGWLLVISGIIGLPFALMGGTIGLQMIIVPLLLAAALVSVVYSLLIWRTAPDRA